MGSNEGFFLEDVRRKKLLFIFLRNNISQNENNDYDDFLVKLKIFAGD